VKTKVHPGRTAAGGQDVTVVEEQEPGLNPDLRVHLSQQAGQRPLGGGRTIVEQPGSGQHEGPRAQARDPSARRVAARSVSSNGSGGDSAGSRQFGMMTRSAVRLKHIVDLLPAVALPSSRRLCHQPELAAPK
jgi:hypothetical protein